MAAKTASNAAAITFPKCTGGTGITANKAALFLASTGGTAIAVGTLASDLAISTNIIPTIPLGDLTYDIAGSGTTALSDAWVNAELEHFFQNAAIANVGDAGGLQPSATPGSFYVGLLDSGNTEANAATTYTGYARVAVARSAAGWDVA